MLTRSTPMKRAPMEHDFTRLGWGHNITFIRIGLDGLSASVIGHGVGVEQGDYLILGNGPSETTRYRVVKLEHRRPADCWSATIEFAPRGEHA